MSSLTAAEATANTGTNTANMFTAAEMTANYVKIGTQKTKYPIFKILLLGYFAGMMISLGSAVTNTATYAISNVSMIRLISGLLFPFGLAIIVLMGAELFTGSCLISISVLNREATLAGMFKTWILVYLSNFAGGITISAACAFFGQLNYSSGGLAVYTIKVAAAKCALPFSSAVVLGIFCNLLVCLGVLCSSCAKDVAGRIMGAYIPVAFFVICGFEHCIANMYYIPAGLFALSVPEYAVKAAEAGINVAGLTWSGFFANNLLPVTIGNIIGGVALGALMWACYLKKANEKSKAFANHFASAVSYLCLHTLGGNKNE